MFNLIAKLSVFTVAGILTVQANAALNDPQKVPALFEKIYVPEGFDSNDHVQVVGTGTFENGCFRPAETKVNIDRVAKKIIVGASAYKYTGICLQAVLKFDRVIELGIVPAGDYDIIQESTNKVMGKINIKQATKSEPDDYLYAPVAQAMVDENGSSTELVIKGEFPTSCMYIKEVKVTVKGDVIVAQPIAEVDQRPDCAVGFYPFRKVVPVQVPAGRYLLHIRSMNANAVNNLVQLQ